MQELLDTKWKSTRADTPPLKNEELENMLDKLGNDWEVIDQKKLRREFKFTNFVRALEFTNKVGEFAEEKNHHPDIHLSWGKAVVEIWTHRISGLARMDFVWAANVEQIYQEEYKDLLPSD